MQGLSLRVPPVRPLVVAVLVSAVLGAAVRRAAAPRLTHAEARSFKQSAGLALSGTGIAAVKVRAFALTTPSRLVLDFSDTVVAAGVPTELRVRCRGVTETRLRQFRTDPDVARVVFTLAEGTPPPQWRLVPQPDSGALLLLQPPGPVTLPSPVVERHQQAWVVRVPGAGSLERRTGALENPIRVFLDFTNAEVPASSGRNISSGPIRQVRVGQQAPDGDLPVARVAIELRSSQAFEETVEGADLVVAFTAVPARDECPDRGSPDTGTYDVPAGPGTYAVPPDPSTFDVPSPPVGRTATLKGRRIAVDPGHGGEDPGAVWSDDTGTVCEADIVLAIGRRVAELLEAAEAQVLLTRQPDGPRPSLQERVRLATDFRAQAYVSIHCDSCALPSETACGTTVYYGRDDSAALAEKVKEEVVKELGTRDRGLDKHPAYYVVREPRCPAILVEVAYINHEADRALLTDPDAQDRTAQAIVRGLAKFFAGHARGDTR